MKQIVRKCLPRDIFVIFLVAIFISFVFLVPGVRTLTKSLALESYYLNSEKNFVVMAPGKTQCAELEKNSFIESAIPFYRTIVTLTSNGNVYGNSDVVILDRWYDEVAFFSSNRLIQEVSSDGVLPLAYIDYSASKEYGLDVGDTFSVSLFNKEYEFLVSKIFETTFDGAETSPVMMLFAEASLLKSFSDYSYSGAYIESSDYVSASDYLDAKYIAQGDLMERDQFDSDEAYEQYNETVLSAKHYVVDMQQIGETILRYSDKKIQGIMYCIMGVFLNLFMLAILCKQKARKKNISSYYLSLYRLGINKGQLTNQLQKLFVFDAFIAEIFLMAAILVSYRLYYLPCKSLLLIILLINLGLSVIEAVSLARVEAKKIDAICLKTIKE